MNITRFYKLLVKARTDEASLVLVIDKIMPMINKYSQNNNSNFLVHDEIFIIFRNRGGEI